MKRTCKADEMEMAISFKAMRLSWAFVLLSLLAWCVGELLVRHEMPFIPFMIICVSNLIFFSAKLILTKKLAGEGSDENEK